MLELIQDFLLFRGPDNQDPSFWALGLAGVAAAMLMSRRHKRD
ncbi:hypothetical protein [uncultured Aquabacterium sp.]|nr:hypothetical protein [uncultured Aquabacterium sp.]